MLNRSSRQGSGQVFDAWTSGNLTRMLNNLETPGHPIDVHYLLLGIIEETYKIRNNSLGMRDLCEIIAFKHLTLFSSIAPFLIKKNFIPRVPTFQILATLLTEKGEYEKAIAVCDMALSYNLHDNTKSGFEGRIERIRKKSGRDGYADLTSNYLKLLQADFEKGMQFKYSGQKYSINKEAPKINIESKSEMIKKSGCAAIVILTAIMIIIIQMVTTRLIIQ